ncbi:MAG TPA: hypothetical protein VLI92_04680 [Candidatus Saccharimonadales bacterium]|nr:hypothetical protein [Candidatus Saccharimonadales bacterium]
MKKKVKNIKWILIALLVIVAIIFILERWQNRKVYCGGPTKVPCPTNSVCIPVGDKPGAGGYCKYF